MGKSQSPYGRIKVKLAHEPGHIFWKKEAVVDKLSLFIERVVEEETVLVKQEESDNRDGDRTPTTQRSQVDEIDAVQNAQDTDANAQDTDTDEGYQESENSQAQDEQQSISSDKQHTDKQKDKSNDSPADQSQKNLDKVVRIVERLYTDLFTDDLMFIRVFDLPPKDLTEDGGLYFRQLSDKQFECRLFLKRFIDPSSCQLLFGAASDIPPGMAVYKINDNFTNEQKYYTKQALGPCMDEEGYMSPAKMYPWFAMGIAKCIENIISEENGEDNGSQDSRQSTHDFDDIEVAGQFPAMNIIFPSENDKKDNKREETGSQASIQVDQLDMNESASETDCDKESANSGRRGRGSAKPMAKSKQAQWYPRGSESTVATPVATPRSTTSSRSGGLQSNRTFSSLSSNVESVKDDLEDDPIVITIKPAIKGYGLPKSIKLQHALPKQKPYCEKGIECITQINNKIEDGQSMWYLEASTVKMNQNIEKSARFRSTFRKIGKVSKFWNISFEPVTKMIQDSMEDVYKKHEFSINLNHVKTFVSRMKVYHGWKCITDEFIDTAVMNVVKGNMLTMRSLGECVTKVIVFLQGVVSSRSCPSFLQPNVNIAQAMDEKEAEWVAKEIKQVLANIEDDPGFVLIYIGYSKKNNDK